MLRRARTHIDRLRDGFHAYTLAVLNRYAGGGGERQASQRLADIRPDHTARYELAADFIPDQGAVLDMACGTGYGAYIVAQRTACRSVLAVDLSIVALYYARWYFSSPKIIYRRGNCLTTPLGPSAFDVAICFETIEHIQDGEKLLRRLYESLQPDGRLILSTPNELGMPFTPERFPFHVRHYTPDELTRLVSRSGFKISRVYAQPDNLSKNIVPGWDGNFNIIVCTRTG